MTAAAVYRAFDLGGTLLYVGCSITPATRYRAHETTAPWWPFKADIAETWYPNVREARAAELQAIVTEHPRWNVVGRSPAHPDGPVRHRYSEPHLREEVAIWREWHATQRTLLAAQDDMYRLNERIANLAGSRGPHASQPA